MLSKATQQKTAFGFGAILVLIMLAIAFICPSPTPFQYTIFRIVLALASAGIAAMIPGFINVEVGTAVRAGGAIAVFAIVYFFSPAALPAPQSNASLSKEYKGHVNQVHLANREAIVEASKDPNTPKPVAKVLTNGLHQLESFKAALDQTITAGEQMAEATNRKQYNDKIEELEKVGVPMTSSGKAESPKASGGGGSGVLGNRLLRVMAPEK